MYVFHVFYVCIVYTELLKNTKKTILMHQKKRKYFNANRYNCIKIYANKINKEINNNKKVFNMKLAAKCIIM